MSLVADIIIWPIMIWALLTAVTFYFVTSFMAIPLLAPIGVLIVGAISLVIYCLPMLILLEI